MAATFGGIQSRRSSMTWQTICYILMILISVVTVVPFLFMASTSFTKSFTMMSYPPTLIPENPSWDNYYDIMFVFQEGLFPRWFFNTLFTTLCITMGPWSSSGDTKCTVAPTALQPASSAR